MRRSQFRCSFIGLSLALMGIAAAGCEDTRTIAGTPRPSELRDKVHSDSGIHPPATSPLHNLMKLSGRIYSGGEPDGDEAFRALADLGVKTVVSVDGIRPDIETAHKYGLKYVHIPIGYDGIEQAKSDALTQLVRKRTGPIYIHCHHGKHRGPAAAAVACIATGAVDNQGGVAILERAGTSRGYAGLWRDVEAFTPPPADAELPELVEVAEVGSFAAAMAEVDRIYDRLVLCGEAGWKTPADHPDVVPAQEALLLKERFHELARSLSDDYDDEFRAQLRAAEKLAAGLEKNINSNLAEAANDDLAKIKASCKTCHTGYRD